MTKLSAVYCTDRHGIIGLVDENGDYSQPINSKLDRRWFMQLTKGKTVLMGAKTARALVDETGGLLPNRKNIVVTTNVETTSKLKRIAETTNDLLEVWDSLDPLGSYTNEEIIVIGGAFLIDRLRDKIETWYVTEFDCDVTTHRDCYQGEPIFTPIVGWTADNFIQEGFERVAYSAFSDVDIPTNLPVTGYFVEYKRV